MNIWYRIILTLLFFYPIGILNSIIISAIFRPLTMRMSSNDNILIFTKNFIKFFCYFTFIFALFLLFLGSHFLSSILFVMSSSAMIQYIPFSLDEERLRNFQFLFSILSNMYFCYLLTNFL